MTWNPKKRLSPARQQHVQENLQKIHARQQNKENHVPQQDSVQPIAPAGTSRVASSRGDLSQQNCQKLAGERERSGAYRSELHTARRREHRLSNAKANLQARLKAAEAGRKRDAVAAKTQLKTVQAKAAEDVGNAEVRAKAAEARAFEAEAQMEQAVDQDAGRGRNLPPAHHQAIC
ncbi:hypothetical protein NUW54_g10247 [Trametes sanguinea]|uniref:Uncharacterized protein n=1 Tax=Trametes sanguinea TaxID=158606 RepID=A0ACC1P0J5_9APHY|nr:hypothetical protein NUW54_g10247 [Trametes sanguinea]